MPARGKLGRQAREQSVFAVELGGIDIDGEVRGYGPLHVVGSHGDADKSSHSGKKRLDGYRGPA